MINTGRDTQGFYGLSTFFGGLAGVLQHGAGGKNNFRGRLYDYRCSAETDTQGNRKSFNK